MTVLSATSVSWVLIRRCWSTFSYIIVSLPETSGFCSFEECTSNAFGFRAVHHSVVSLLLPLPCTYEAKCFLHSSTTMLAYVQTEDFSRQRKCFQRGALIFKSIYKNDSKMVHICCPPWFLSLANKKEIHSHPFSTL